MTKTVRKKAARTEIKQYPLVKSEPRLNHTLKSVFRNLAPGPVSLQDVLYEGDQRLKNSSVKLLERRSVAEFDGFDPNLLLSHHDDNEFNSLVDSSPQISGQVLIAFEHIHAIVVILPKEEKWFDEQECFTEVYEYQNIVVELAYLVHVTFLNKTSPDYKLQWLEWNNVPLSRFERIFYVCDFTDQHYLQVQSIAVSSKPDFYSTFYADCLEFAKVFAKNFLVVAEIQSNGQMIDRINALAITGTRLELISRNNLSSGVMGNRLLSTGTRILTTSASFWSTFVAVLAALVVFRFIDKFLLAN